MSTINIDLAADTILNVMIGQQDENEVREVVFDFSGWYTTYGSGTISLAIQRPKDEWPYEGTLIVDSTNHEATWEISETDTAYAGTGKIQLSYKVGDAKKKSVVYRFTCHKSLGALGSVVTPVQIQTFIDEVEEALQTMDGRLDNMDDQITDVKADLTDLEDRVEVLEEGGGSGVPAEVKAAIYALLDAAGYGETGVSDELAIVQAWATTTSSITLNTSEITISGTGTNQLTATTVPSGNPVSWSSSNPNVATVSNTGLVTGVGNGSCVITASSGNVSATCSVSVSGFTMYTITNNLTNATNSNPATSIASGASYSSSLTPDSGYFLDAVTITMGGVDITSTAYDSGNVEISSVTGDIVITVTTYKDTTAELYKEGYILAHQNNSIIEMSVTNGGITITYDMDAPTTVLYPAGVIPYKSQMFYSNQGELQILKDGTPVSYVDITSRWAKAYNDSHTYTEFDKSWNASEYNQIRFSVDIRALDDAYMYDKTTGQVWFAGINTPYYGMSNISEANS